MTAVPIPEDDESVWTNRGDDDLDEDAAERIDTDGRNVQRASGHQGGQVPFMASRCVSRPPMTEPIVFTVLLHPNTGSLPHVHHIHQLPQYSGEVHTVNSPQLEAVKGIVTP